MYVPYVPGSVNNSGHSASFSESAPPTPPNQCVFYLQIQFFHSLQGNFLLYLKNYFLTLGVKDTSYVCVGSSLFSVPILLSLLALATLFWFLCLHYNYHGLFLCGVDLILSQICSFPC